MAQGGSRNKGVSSQFRFLGRSYGYCTQAYNEAAHNERTVEVPLAAAAVREARGRVLEVGHVLGHYGVLGHTVVDLHERAPGVLNVDIETFAPGDRFDLIVSVSTLEHMGFDGEPKDPEKPLRVLCHLREALLSPGGRLLVTLPLGYNPDLDARLRAGELGGEVRFLKRLNRKNEWREVPAGQAQDARYGRPFPNANAIAVLSWVRECQGEGALGVRGCTGEEGEGVSGRHEHGTRSRTPGAQIPATPSPTPSSPTSLRACAPTPSSATHPLTPSPIPSSPLNWDTAPEFGRRETLVRALRRLAAVRPGPSTLVETGTLRDDRALGRSGDGWSTLAFAWFAAETGGRLHTVDLDPEALAICRKVTAPYAGRVEYACGDSRAFLADWVSAGRGEIHFLYLDSVDYTDREVSEAHHLAEAEAALPALADPCFVLFDDTHAVSEDGASPSHSSLLASHLSSPPPITPRSSLLTPRLSPYRGKGARAIPFLLAHGFTVEWAEGGQVLLSRGVPETLPEAPPAAPRELPRRFLPGRPPIARSEAARREAVFATPLLGVPRAFAAWVGEPAHRVYLETIRHLCRDGRCGEVACGDGYATAWLAQQGLAAEGWDPDPRLAERCWSVVRRLGVAAPFQADDGAQDPGRFRVLHSREVLDTLPLPWLRAALARQLARADHLVFLARAATGPEAADEAGVFQLTAADWAWVLQPFPVRQLRPVGNPAAGPPTHLLGVLDGRAPGFDPTPWLTLEPEPYPFGISAVVLTRNESRRIDACLGALEGWTDEILVCDMASTDDTVARALTHTPHVFTHPHIENFDRARNAAALRARFRWVLFIDADELPGPEFGPRFRRLLEQHGPGFEAVRLPFRHFFAGRHLTHLDPGYKAPSLFKNGCFHFRARPHAGARVEGRVVVYPPQAGVVDHHSHASIAHYLQKMNSYTTTEAAAQRQDGERFHWHRLAEAWVRDMQGYYDGLEARRDDVHGLLYALMGGFYRLVQHGKLYEQRFAAGQLTAEEREAPASVAEFLDYALAVLDGRAGTPPPRAIPPLEIEAAAPDRARVVWFGPFENASGYGEESRAFLLALDAAGLPVAGQRTDWRAQPLALPPAEGERLRVLLSRPAAPAFVQVVQDLPFRVERHPQAVRTIVRTMFETDRIPAVWAAACNRFDAVWVPSEFNRETFRLSGVAAEKLVVIPGCLDPAFCEGSERGEEGEGGDLSDLTHSPSRPLTPAPPHRPARPFRFLSVFDWTLHKGWDVLLPVFAREFAGREDVELVLKVWSSIGYAPEEMQRHAATRVALAGCDPGGPPRIRFVFERLSGPELCALYRSADAFVLPSRGEGWGRPLMEAMACGRPAIGTGWSGNTEFMTEENSFLLPFRLVPVPQEGWEEIPQYRGHRWAEPDREALAAALRAVVADPAAAVARGERGRETVLRLCSPAAVAARMAAELEREAQRAAVAPAGAGDEQDPRQWTNGAAPAPPRGVVIPAVGSQTEAVDGN